MQKEAHSRKANVTAIVKGTTAGARITVALWKIERRGTGGGKRGTANLEEWNWRFWIYGEGFQGRASRRRRHQESWNAWNVSVIGKTANATDSGTNLTSRDVPSKLVAKVKRKVRMHHAPWVAIPKIVLKLLGERISRTTMANKRQWRESRTGDVKTRLYAYPSGSIDNVFKRLIIRGLFLKVLIFI